MGKLTTEQYVLTETERAIMEAVWEGTNGERPHRMYTGWVADAIHRRESTAARLANGLARKGLLERQQEKHAEYVYWETTTAGTPFPDPLERPGRVTALCGHGIAGSEWRAGFRWCERCWN
jgi:hypothetical protein